MFTVVIRPDAKLELQDATFFYKNISTKLAESFIKRIEEAVLFISIHPLALAIKYNGIRIILLKQFPYHIHYLIEESKNEIIILAIIHAYKNPNNYSTRK